MFKNMNIFILVSIKLIQRCIPISEMLNVKTVCRGFLTHKTPSLLSPELHTAADLTSFPVFSLGLTSSSFMSLGWSFPLLSQPIEILALAWDLTQGLTCLWGFQDCSFDHSVLPGLMMLTPLNRALSPTDIKDRLLDSGRRWGWDDWRE